MNATQAKESADKVVLLIVGSLCKTGFKISEYPDKWERANYYVEEALLQASREARKEAIRQCAEIVNRSWAVTK